MYANGEVRESLAENIDTQNIETKSETGDSACTVEQHNISISVQLVYVSTFIKVPPFICGTVWSLVFKIKRYLLLVDQKMNWFS